jgi:thimet oligopeptidase
MSQASREPRPLAICRLLALTAVCGAALVSPPPGPTAQAQTTQTASSLSAAAPVPPFYTGITGAASLRVEVTAALSRARAAQERLLAVKGARTVANTLRPYDDILVELNAAGGLTNIVRALHPDADMRNAADALGRDVAAFTADLGVNRDVFDALAAIDPANADAAAVRLLEQELDTFRRQGVSLAPAARERLKALRTRLVEATNAFDRNFRQGVRRFTVSGDDALAGLPGDFVASHKPDAAGAIALSTEAPDVQPVMLYARNDALRRQMFLEWQNVAYPENMAVLQEIRSLRSEIARALGYDDWASYELSTRMARTPEAAESFIARVVAASAGAAERDYRLLLERKQQDDPAARDVRPWQRRYYTELLRQSQYRFDSQALRPYFPYDRVRDGVLDVARRLFGFEFRRAALPVWHPSVESYEVLERGVLVGRIYLDMHTRAGKGGTGASSGAARNGVTGRHVPEVVLLARFPGGTPGDPGLMTADQVVNFFHEFGHLVHAVASGAQSWIGLARVAELDFNESPAIVFEEWASDPATLQTFARHHITNEPIPAALVQQMKRASELGRGYDVRQQMVYAHLSLALHQGAPDRVDPTALHHDLTLRYLPTGSIEGTHFPASFTHLSNPNYASAYYGYMWSQVIARDLVAQFDAGRMLDPSVAGRFRQTILDQGGARPAAQLVTGFLNRPFRFDAFEAWLNRDTPLPR